MNEEELKNQESLGTEVEVREVRSGVPTFPQLIVALSILVLVLGFPLAERLLKQPEAPKAPQAEVIEEKPVSYPEDPYSDVALEASAAYVWDVAAQKALYAKNAHAQLPLASLTKLMTGLVAYEAYGTDKRVAVTLDAIAQEGENGFSDGESWIAKELLNFTLITSSNDGAYALAAAAGASRDIGNPESAFVAMMNEKARALGLAQTYFTNPTGLDTSESESGSYGSARDMAYLMEYIIENAPEVVEDTIREVKTYADVSGTLHTATNTNESIGKIVNPLGSKTGYTLLAGGNLVVAYDAGLNHPIIIAVLGSSREGRFKDVEALIKHTEQSFIPLP